MSPQGHPLMRGLGSLQPIAGLCQPVVNQWSDTRRRVGATFPLLLTEPHPQSSGVLSPLQGCGHLYHDCQLAQRGTEALVVPCPGALSPCLLKPASSDSLASLFSHLSAIRQQWCWQRHSSPRTLGAVACKAPMCVSQGWMLTSRLMKIAAMSAGLSTSRRGPM